MHRRAREFRDRARGVHGVDLAVEEFPEGTKTAAEAADALGCDVAQIASSIVFVVERESGTRGTSDSGIDGGVVVVVTSGANRVDEAKLADRLGVEDRAVRTADPAEVRASVGWSIGGVPPFCHDGAVPTYVDETLLDYDTVWAAAGTPQAVFSIDPGHLRELADAEAVDVAE